MIRISMPRPCAVETHARCYKEGAEKFCGCHGLVPWRVTLAAIIVAAESFCRCHGLCAVEAHVSHEVKRQLRHQRETPRHKAVASQKVRASFLATSVKLHGARPWHLRKFAASFLATSVKLHGARPWHQVVKPLLDKPTTRKVHDLSLLVG